MIQWHYGPPTWWTWRTWRTWSQTSNHSASRPGDDIWLVALDELLGRTWGCLVWWKPETNLESPFFKKKSGWGFNHIAVRTSFDLKNIGSYQRADMTNRKVIAICDSRNASDKNCLEAETGPAPESRWTTSVRMITVTSCEIYNHHPSVQAWWFRGAEKSGDLFENSLDQSNNWFKSMHGIYSQMIYIYI